MDIVSRHFGRLLRNGGGLAAVAVLVTAGASAGASARRTGSVPADSIDAYVRREIATRRIPGVAVAVVEGGTIVFEKGYGVADVEAQSPVTPRSVFELASITKQFTAACIMMLAREHKIRLDESITAYLSGAPETWRGITVRQLLTHTSGLPIDAIVGHDGSALLNISTRQAFDFVAAAPLRFAPGARWSYSDAGYFLLGMIIEKASGQTYREFMQRRIFDPLEMRESSILDRWRIVPNHVPVYTMRQGELAHWRRDWQYELPSFFGVNSTLGDLAKWDNAIRQGTLLPDSTWRQAWTPVRLTTGFDAWPAYGFGWSLGEMRGHRVAEHSGASGTFLLHFVDRSLTVIVLTNLDVPSGPHAATLAHGIAARLIPESATARAAPAVPDAALGATIDALLSDVAAGHDSPAMTPSHRAFYAELPAPVRQGLARQLSTRRALTYLGSEDVRGRSITITDPVARIAYFRADVDDRPLHFTFYITTDGKVAQMRLAPQQP